MFFASLFNPVLTFTSAHRKLVVRFFRLMYVAFAIVVPVLCYLQVTNPNSSDLVDFLGNGAGQMSIILFFLCTFPGILGRFRMRHPLITIGMSFRRQVGISSFLLGFAHALLVYIVPAIGTGTIFLALSAYVVFGILALVIFFLLFLTSNDFSTRFLGKRWKLLHRSVYRAYWLIFLHLMFFKGGLESYVIGGVAILELLSLIYDFGKKRKAV